MYTIIFTFAGTKYAVTIKEAFDEAEAISKAFDWATQKDKKFTAIECVINVTEL
jgi:hypothetical protein